MRTRIHRRKKTTHEAQPTNYNLHPQPFPLQKSSSKKTNNNLQTSNSSSNRETDNKSNLPHFSISAPQGAYDYLQKYSQVNNTLQLKPSKLRTERNRIKETNYADALIQSEKVNLEVRSIYKEVKDWYNSNPKIEGTLKKYLQHPQKQGKLHQEMSGYKKLNIYYSGLGGYMIRKDYRNYTQQNFNDIKQMITWIADVSGAYWRIKREKMYKPNYLVSEENQTFVGNSRVIEQTLKI